MKQRYQYRIYPIEQQQTDLAKLFGCCRVVWNDALAMCRAAEKLPKNSSLQKICITQAKRTDGREWLGEVSNIPLQQSVADLGVAFKNFFSSLKGERKGPKVRPPRFKKRDNRQTARFTRGGFSLRAAKVYLAKIGEVKTRWSRPLPSEPSSVTVIKDRSGRYFLSFVVEPEPVSLPAQSASVGVDLGLKTFAALSAGELVKAPDYSTLERKIRREQRKLSRRQKGSKRRERSRLRVAKLKARLRDTRKDFLHQLSTRLIQENQLVCLEDLNVSGMLKNRCLSRAISQAGWREFRTMLESKARRLGRQVQVISRWQPTSQLCSECGYRWGKLDLKVRELACLSCGTRHDRDINAAKNINQSGRDIAHDVKRTGSPCQPGLPAVGVELSSHPYGERPCLIS